MGRNIFLPRNAIAKDDLFSRQPFCQALKDKHGHFILVCKPDSHTHLYQRVDFLAANQTVLALVDEHYHAIRQALGTRRPFFQDLEALLRYFQFESWEAVFLFMFKGRELDTG